jgi:hypothetical protein
MVYIGCQLVETDPQKKKAHTHSKTFTRVEGHMEKEGNVAERMKCCALKS